MLLPTTFSSAFLLLILSLICFGIWPDLYKRNEMRWRFELFSLDFAFGAVIAALITAYTFGTFGPEISFTDRMLIAGRLSNAWLLAAGFLFTLGNMLLLAGIRLIGMASAFLVAWGTAGAIFSLLHYGSAKPDLFYLAAALFAVSVTCAAIATTKLFASNAPVNQQTRANKGLFLGVISGLAFSALNPVLKHTADPEFGPGPYATTLMMSIGILIATPIFNFFFMNIRIVGQPIGFGHYGQGKRGLHIPGLVSGGLFAVGLLALVLATSVTGGEEAPGAGVMILVPALAVVSSVLLGLLKWKEAAAQSSARFWIFVSGFALVIGLILLTMAAVKSGNPGAGISLTELVPR